MDAKHLADVFAHEYRLHLNKVGASSTVTTPVGNFCAIWPQAKMAIGVVSGFIAWVPNYGTMISAALQALLKVGDEISGSVCAGAAGTDPKLPLGDEDHHLA